MIEPEFVQEERLPLIQNYDSVYEDTQETSFNDAQQDEKCQPSNSDIHNRLKADMIESLFRHMGWEIDENMIELHLDRFKMEQENGQTILSFKKIWQMVQLDIQTNLSLIHI